MRVYVYTGPTLSATQGSTILDARYLPPIKHGDILDALSEGVECIAIIDGYYETTAATRHKEILQALAAGVRVIGSSSLGALRAAELDIFGMEGIGEVYRMYAGGEIDGDDEVAIKHAPHSDNYRMLSIPLVDLRYNLKRLVDNGDITNSTQELIIDCAKNIYFGARTLKRILNLAGQSGLDATMIDHCREQLNQNWFDLKRADARLMLETIKHRINGQQQWPALPPLQVYKTDLLHRWNGEQARVQTSLGFIREQEVVAQISFSSDEYPRARQSANEQAWLKDYADRLDLKVSSAELNAEREQFRQQEQLVNDAAEADWLAERVLTAEQLTDKLQLNALLNKLSHRNGKSQTRAELLLEYARLRSITASPAAIESEWPKAYQEITIKGITAENLFITPVIDLASPPSRQPLELPDRDSWCRDNQSDLAEVIDWLGKRAILRRFAGNFYYKPAIIDREMIIRELKFRGVFHQRLAELLLIYQRVSQSGISASYHPQWKVFIQPDIREIMIWYCKQQQLQPRCFQEYLIWKGFDDLNNFFDIAQLNYICSTQLVSEAMQA